MALKLNDLPPGRIRDAAAAAINAPLLARRAARRRKLLEQATVPASLTLWLPGQPRNTTHHDKTIGKDKKTGQAFLFDSEALRAVRNAYALLIPANAAARLQSPVRAYVEVRWHRDAIDDTEYRTTKPDWDNFAKPLMDAIAKRGWIVGDEQVADGRLVKLHVADPRLAGVYVRLETIRGYSYPLAPIPASRCEFLPFDDEV
jgi:Holliday junction resolvase RusA-like endonuclease